MLKFFRKICQKLLVDLPSGQAGKKMEITLNTPLRKSNFLNMLIISPVRDLIWVEQTINQDETVPLGTGYVRNLMTSQIILLTYGTHIKFLNSCSTDILSLRDIQNTVAISRAQIPW